MGASFDIGPAHVKILIFFQASTWSSWVYCWDQGRIYSCGSIVLSTYRTQRNDSYVNVTFSSVCVCWVVSPVEEIVSKCKFKIYCNILLGHQYDAVCQIHFMPPHSLLLLTSWHSNGAWRWRRVFQLMLLKYFQCKILKGTCERFTNFTRKKDWPFTHHFIYFIVNVMCKMVMRAWQTKCV